MPWLQWLLYEMPHLDESPARFLNLLVQLAQVIAHVGDGEPVPASFLRLMKLLQRDLVR
jgi:hypothetical protein